MFADTNNKEVAALLSAYLKMTERTTKKSSVASKEVVFRITRAQARFLETHERTMLSNREDSNE